MVPKSVLLTLCSALYTLSVASRYEQGWGKKLTFVFGVTPHSVEDVSARPALDSSATLCRRQSYTLSVALAGRMLRVFSV